MAKIKIEPESLEATSHKISALKLRIAQLENELLKAGNTAPSYEGQFKPRVLGLSTQAKSQLGQRTTTLDTQAARLEKIAKRFMEADRQFQSSNRLSYFLDQVRNTIGAWLGDLGLGQMSQISLLGALFATDLPRMPWNPKPVYGSDDIKRIRFSKVEIVAILIGAIWISIWREIRESFRRSPDNESPEIDDDTIDSSTITPSLKPTSPVAPLPPVSPPQPPPPPRYPVPPTSPVLREANPINYETCALYAKARRPDLGSTNHPKHAAAGYITKFQNKAFQLEANDDDYRNIIGVGYAVVWDPGVAGANASAGHVAIVEEVGPDYIIVSHAGWDTGTRTKLTFNKTLQYVWIIP